VSGVIGVPAPAGLVHGMGKELVEPDWSPLTSTEVRTVLARYPQPAVRPVLAGIPGTVPEGIPGTTPAGTSAGDEMITWRSPRPMSAAALVRRGGVDLFVKRHHVRVRTPAQLAVEHAFIGHLRAHGIPAPAVLRTADGASATQQGDFVYEVHEVAAGLDLYRDAVSWTPYTSLGHARAAGAALARLHAAADRFPLPARSPAVLTSGCELIVAADPLAELKWLTGRRPGLAAYLDGRPWPEDLARHVLPAIWRAAPLLAGLPRQWGHGDWHPSNLTWTSAGADAVIAGVFDFGLANRTFAVHDLATALERATVSWLDLTDLGRAEADLDAINALLDGYESVRPLTRAEAAALPEVFPVVHVEYALSEVEYFAHVVNSPANADLAYDGYLLSHAAWFGTSDGATVLDHLRRRAASA
jgi:Ser/Thr protein kinase RdoA (MazF antagonist)